MRRLLCMAASLRLTPLPMAGLVVGVLVSYRADDPHPLWMVAPLAALALNLSCAMLVHPRLRRNAGLLVFHACLLGILLLAAWEQLTHFSARIELRAGQRFTASDLHQVRAGPLHSLGPLHALVLTQGPFTVDYAPSLRRGATRSQLRLGDDGRRYASVGDNQPLRANGYRFYTTSNKGYAALLVWQDAGTGERQAGAVHFPPFPLNDWRQVNEWVTPAGTRLQLEFVPGTKMPSDRAWTLDSRNADGVLRLSVAGAEPQVLERGDMVQLSGGTLRFTGVSMWMGYQLRYSGILAWMFATALVGALGLGGYYWQRFATSPLPAARDAVTEAAGEAAHA